MAEALGLDRDTVFFRKVRAYELEALATLRKKENTCTPQKKEMCKFQYGDLFEWTCSQCKEMNKNERS